MLEPLFIITLFIGSGFILSLVQDSHLKKPFLSKMGFRMVSLGSFSFFLLGSFAALKFLFGFWKHSRFVRIVHLVHLARYDLFEKWHPEKFNLIFRIDQSHDSIPYRSCFFFISSGLKKMPDQFFRRMPLFCICKYQFKNLESFATKFATNSKKITLIICFSSD